MFGLFGGPLHTYANPFMDNDLFLIVHNKKWVPKETRAPEVSASEQIFDTGTLLAIAIICMNFKTQ